MQVEILKGQKKESVSMSFILEGATTAFANTIRRCAIEDVPSMAIEEVEIRKNTSVMYDEVLAHRLGLITIKTDLKSYNLPDECPCKGAGCAQCQLKLSIKTKGPTVYASEIESQDPKSVPVYPKTPITKLLKGQVLEAEMTAVLGKGKVHSKWTPGHVYYKYRPEITISKKGQSCIDCVKICPRGVFEKKNDTLVINKDNLLNCHLCGACEDLSDGEVKVQKEVHDFVFYVESFGQLSVEEIMLNAAEQLDLKLDDFLENFKNTAK